MPEELSRERNGKEAKAEDVNITGTPDNRFRYLHHISRHVKLSWASPCLSFSS